MREGWEYKKLVDECDILYGYPFNSKSFSTSEEDMPLVRIRDVKEGRTSTFFKGDYPQEYIIHKGDYLIGMDGEFNISPWKSADALLNQRVCKISCKTSNILMRYVYRFLVKELKKIEDETPFVTVKHLSAKKLNQIQLPIPPLDEQERIVAELDLLSSIIDKKKAQLKELDQLAQSIFYDMFGTTIEEKGWEVKKMGEIGTFQRGGGFLKSDFVENGVPCIHYGQIHMKFGPFLYQHLTEIPKEVAAKSKIASKGDVIIAITSEDVEGSCKCTAWLGDYDVYIGAHAAIFKHSLNPIYVSYYIGASEFQREKQKYVHGIKVMEIKPSDIEKINILLPPLPLQQEFASKIEAIERQKSLIQQSIVETQTLFDSRMEHWFN